ncbi:uncharacterized protein [Watersipora subatra]|uniref:uncharacterized protein n=1 Tax=Watersipora subatra TaxID=2589382 RepID=UPI00355AF014
METPLTKSFVPKSISDTAFKYRLFYKLFDDVKKEKRSCLLVNMDTKETVSNLEILAQSEEYAKGLLRLNLTPGIDNIALIGCSTFQALALFAAAAEIGIGFAHLFIHPPREERITTQIKLLAPKVIVCGEGAGGHNASALFSLLDSEPTDKISGKLPSLEHIFYDSSYKDRSPTHKSVKTLYKLKELGETVSDDQLTEARERVQPDFVCQHLFTSGSAGHPKCTSRAQEAIVKLTSVGQGPLQTTMVMNMNVDTMASYVYLLYGLVGLCGTIITIPESYEENPMKNQGKILVETIIEKKVEQLILTMSALGAIIDYIKENKISIPHPLKRVFYSGQIISYQFLEDGEQLLKGVHCIGYGMTELIGIGATSFIDSSKRKVCTKEARLLPYPFATVRIADEQNKTLDIEQIGEIQVNSPLAIKEYRLEEEQTQRLFSPDGFIKTGDAGIMFPDGTFKVLGRMNDNDRFKIYGKVEYSGPIENIISLHPEISQAYVVTGKRNDWIGDEITCCILAKEKSKKIPEDMLLEFCKANGMYQRQQPARILYFDEFPSTHNERKVKL